MSFNYLKYLIVFFFIIILIPSFFIPTITKYSNIEINNNDNNFQDFYISNFNFYWPIPGYVKISSYFGKRISPTNGASSYHQGLDIPAPSGAKIIATLNGIITFTGFKGSGGYTIILKNNSLEFIYHHVSPNYIVNIGDYVDAGQIIGYVRTKKCI